jgi:hypothetical protein
MFGKMKLDKKKSNETIGNLFLKNAFVTMAQTKEEKAQVQKWFDAFEKNGIGATTALKIMVEIGMEDNK